MATEHKQALDLISNGNWEAAHHLIQHQHDELACLIHAYLHREEGDISNATYWYSKVNQPLPGNTLEQELARLYQLASASNN